MNKIASNIKALRLLLTGLLFLLAFCQVAHANLVTNPFFTGTGAVANNTAGAAAGTQAATSWASFYCCNGFGSAFNHGVTVRDPASLVNPRPAVPAAITAAGGTTEFYTGCNSSANACLSFPLVAGQSSGAQQAIPTVIGTSYILRFWVFSSGLGTGTTTNKAEIDVYWGNTLVYAGVNVTPVGWSLQTINLGGATAATTNLSVLIQDDPDLSAITFMDVEPVVLRLAKTNPTSLVVGVPANYSFSISNISTTASGTSFQLQDQLPPNIQYNSVAFGAGLTGASCVASGTVVAGQLLTCTITTAVGGIPIGGTGALTINVTPLAASAAIASVNKASVQYSGGVLGVAASASMSTIAIPSTCTGTDTPSLGCAVAASITPAAAQLTFTKTATLICDPFNGTSNQKNIPGAVVRWIMTVANTGATSVNLTTVSDLLSVNTTFDPNLITGAGGAAGCNSATGTPESAAGKGFKLSIVGGTRPAAAYPKFFTTAADADAATLSGATVTINYALGLPLEAGYTAGQLNPGESVVVYFNVTIN